MKLTDIKKPNLAFWYNLNDLYPNRNDKVAIAQLLGTIKAEYETPSPGHYKITNFDPAECKGVMFYPKTGKVIIQLLGKNKAITFVSEHPKVLMNKIQSVLLK